MKEITPEQEHENSVYITKLSFVAAAVPGMLYSFFPTISYALIALSLAFIYWYVLGNIVSNIIHLLDIEGNEKSG